ncbi:hypothetical protein B0I32_106205 [Nonomuraea fuscirosea]|uniref:Uncharacterized protein n=1 Tax=Nonomuraea fuscirosea TaxID=1291556 RepID=A0A2T0N2B2_9ACTN|nr:hypothetical protein [Nonomuraea fuscirosea]PRX66069.1 hypothetical protein B0I32_106205 [Nonomuraea fuscirosea]
MSEIKLRAREFVRLLAILVGGSALAGGAAVMPGGVLPAMAIAFMTIAAVYAGQQLAVWRIQQQLQRSR